ncbi:hypothetical protein A8U91_02495 [Halomonas elongata]|uniref:Uncharacterized protein n=1 Tax=Halomonas elongata TaxID=2746 RepID=A0A1B8P7A8_HALEL|nr:hypothetical protein A8U91_02495 [Halomonas elongata]
MESWTFLAFFIASATTLAMAVTALLLDRRR